uniref:Sigma 1s n=1 Tax=Mammalian orthoreovirus TaxID=351073 RepID=A0A346M2X6_9REOV|nr:sigma 1s [Mammalian orthoreovirus]
MGRSTKNSRKSRNKSRSTLLISGIPILGLMGSEDRLMASVIASQPLNADWVRWMVDLWLSRTNLRSYLTQLAKTLKTYPLWVTDSMLSNQELTTWIHSRLISLDEHPLWRQMLEESVLNCPH